MGVRTPSAGERVKEEIVKNVPAAGIDVLQLDVGPVCFGFWQLLATKS
jgi:hypothetical protein